jgi:hypothetical protein
LGWALLGGSKGKGRGHTNMDERKKRKEEMLLMEKT